MRTWVIATVFLVIALWEKSEAKTQYLQIYPDSTDNQIRIPRQSQYSYPVDRLFQLDLHQPLPRNDHSFGSQFKRTFNNYRRDALQSYNQKIEDRNDNNDQLTDSSTAYDDYKTSQTTHLVGPHQLETIESQHYHKKVPAFDVSDFQKHHNENEKHAEVHYHKHKHMHKHSHKQEHVHQHKNEHQHKHEHNQEHKHEHHSDHKHAHDHKHDHHQDHKHDHHHDHKHDHHQDHKHQHHHGHKHSHHSNNKHQHHHGHKHEHKHGHEHKHKQHHKSY